MVAAWSFLLAASVGAPAEQLLPRVVATQPQALCFSEPEPVAAPVPVAPAPICSVLSRW